ncbi:hypothetical protein P3102_09630 [Amycolatopsis sp. QT-25]|uniref:hypothetical protein n=1 Tax=Amycolatopsis sp. QT-25 TaxID=3034022 RepID=UPI0023ED98EE|nr:hypothetical protein [Amycolatopsis sp. QT-25]WET81445.1 hypothetical protein P3102_09630 [Amycolatopsis sp. QT-25]
MEDRQLETHPDLLDPDWRKQAERAARPGAKQDLEGRRKLRPRRRFRMSRWHVVVLRMAGSLTAKPGDKGELIVHASYAVAYAFDARPAEARSPADIVPFVREEQDYVIRKAPPFAKADAGLSFGDGASYRSRMACDAIKTGVLAPQYADKDRPVVGVPAGDDAAAYDPTKPLPSLNTCG